MKGSFFVGHDSESRFQVKEFELPPIGEYDVLVRNMACGICGTDVHIYHGDPGASEVSPPVILGHELAGVVEAVGEKVSVVSVGDHVAVDPNIYCGKCLPCRMGKKQNCQNLSAIGVTRNGGFAEFSVCPENQLFKVNDDVDFDVASMTEPLACVIHGIDLAQIKPGQTVAVVGGGAIGLLMVQMAKLSGASSVILSEPVEARRAMGLEVGADYTINPITDDIKGKIREYLNRDGVDVVIECVGNPKAAEQVFLFADAGATILFFSVPKPDATVAVPLYDVFKKELKIIGSIINPDTHQRAVNLINSGRLEIKKLITHSYGLDCLEEAIKMQMSDKSIKVVIHSQE